MRLGPLWIMTLAAILAVFLGAGATSRAAPAAGDPDAPAEPAAAGDSAAASDPAAAESAPPAAPVVARPASAVEYSVGTRIRGIFVPAWFLEAFMLHAHSLNSVSWGLDFTRRKGNLDIVFALDVGWYGNIAPANWTGTYEDGGYELDTYWTEFDSFVFTSLDVNWIWHHDFTEWFALRYGGGIGLGFLTGSIARWRSVGCVSSNVDNAACHVDRNQPDETDLSNYRVLPVVSVLLGLRFKVHPRAVITVDGGFHNAFFFGGGGQYVF